MAISIVSAASGLTESIPVTALFPSRPCTGPIGTPNELPGEQFGGHAPFYGPATPTVVGLLERLVHATTADLRWLAGTGARERIGEPPWPDATSRDEDETLRVSSELAARDAQAAASQAGAGASATRAAARVAHLLVLRHAFAASVFDRHAAPWLGSWIQGTLETGPRVRARP